MVKTTRIQSIESFLAKASLENLQLMVKNLQGGESLKKQLGVLRKDQGALKAGKESLKQNLQTAEETIKNSLDNLQKSEVNRSKAYDRIFKHLSNDGQVNDSKLSDHKIMQMLDGVDITPKEWAALVPGSPLVQGEFEKRELSEEDLWLDDENQEQHSESDEQNQEDEQDSEFEPCEKEFTVKSVLVKF